MSAGYVVALRTLPHIRIVDGGRLVCEGALA
jgi:hypothetical protein